MEVVEEKLTALGTLEAFIMLKTPPGERVGEVYPGWDYMQAVDSNWERRLLARMDRGHLTYMPRNNKRSIQSETWVKKARGPVQGYADNRRCGSSA